MRYTIHVRVSGVLYLVNCGLTAADVTALIKEIENYGHEAQVHVAGSIDEPMNAPHLSMAALRALPRSGRCAA